MQPIEPERAPTPQPPAQSGAVPPDYTMGMPPMMRMFTQFGFAGLAALMLVMMYRDISRDGKEMREMYRDESDRNRVELRTMSEAADRRNDAADKRNTEIASRLTSLTHELQRATDVLRAAGLKLGQVIPDKHDPDWESGVTVPATPLTPLTVPPRPKPDPATGRGDNP